MCLTSSVTIATGVTDVSPCLDLQKIHREIDRQVVGDRDRRAAGAVHLVESRAVIGEELDDFAHFRLRAGAQSNRLVHDGAA